MFKANFMTGSNDDDLNDLVERAERVDYHMLGTLCLQALSLDLEGQGEHMIITHLMRGLEGSEVRLT